MSLLYSVSAASKAASSDAVIKAVLSEPRRGRGPEDGKAGDEGLGAGAERTDGTEDDEAPDDDAPFGTRGLTTR